MLSPGFASLVFLLVNTPSMLWHFSGSLLIRCPITAGKLRNAGPEKTKSIQATFLMISWPIGDSQLAPPNAVTTLEFQDLIFLAIAIDATFCENIEVKPTRFA